MGAGFSVRVVVRSYEVRHARAEHLRAAGCSMQRMVDSGSGLVLLETRVRFLRELRHGDEVEVDPRLELGAGKTFEMGHTITRDDGVVACEISCRLGVLDAGTRRLVTDPAGRLRELATDPVLLGL